jgi:hypothetical protein
MFIIIYKFIIYIHILIDGASILHFALAPKKSGTALGPAEASGVGLSTTGYWIPFIFI